MNWFSILIFILWIYLLTVQKRGKLDFWYFITGSVGFFIFSIIWIEPIVVGPMQKAVAAVSGILGQLTGLYESYFQKGIIFISSGGTNLSLYIDFECSGIIETLAFIALLWFFPVYRLYEKIVVSIAGALLIFASNVLRIFVICFTIYCFGGEMYFLAHTIIGRLVFYACTITLYFYVFTKSQIIRQKVGAFRYEIHK